MSDEQREMTLAEWIDTLPDFHLAHREYDALCTRVHELEAEVERLRDALVLVSDFLRHRLNYEYVRGGDSQFTTINTPEVLETLAVVEVALGIKDVPPWYKVIEDYGAILWTQSMTDSDLPEGAVECWCCNGGKGTVYEHGTEVACPTCHGTGHVCAECGGAKEEPQHRHLRDDLRHSEWMSHNYEHRVDELLDPCTADYHKGAI